MESTSNNHFYLQTSWKALNYFNVYRLLLSGLFVTLSWIGQLPKPLGIYSQALFNNASHVYFFLSLALFYLVSLRQPRFRLQVAVHSLVDIVLLTTLMYASSGLNSGFGMLLVIAVAGSSILATKRIAISIAALASIAVLSGEIYAEFNQFYPKTNYVHAGFLGITFFITSIIGQTLASRAERSEALARQSAIDLKNLSQLNEFIVHRMQAGILVVDGGNKVRLHNQAAQRMLGIDNTAYGYKLDEISPDIDEKLNNWKKYGSEQNVVVNIRESGIEIQVTFSKLSIESTFETLIFLEDVASLRQHVQQMKLVSLGRLTASIAHEVRNPLGAISNAGQLLSESSSLNTEDRRLSDIIQEHSQRVNSIIENVTSISRREPSIPQGIALNSWLKNFIDELITQQNLDKSEIALKIDKQDLCVKMDSIQFNQILWNLCENALRYSKHKPLIEFKCGVRPETERPYLDVIDTGVGMSEKNAEQLFEPFFTSEREGSGMGLYIARELCEANQANLALYSNTKKGCCFRITFSHPDKHHRMI